MSVYTSAWLTMLCLLSGCAPSSIAAPAPEPAAAAVPCRTSATPKTCAVVLPGWGGPQGVFLEGPGFERLHYAAVLHEFRGIFPPPTGATLAPVVTCGTASSQNVVVQQCVSSGGAASCRVRLTDPSGFCGVPPDASTNVEVEVLIVRGFWNASGAWQDIPGPGFVTLSCNASSPAPASGQDPRANGAIAKCQHFDPVTQRDAFLACIRMQRADYCGDGHSHTTGGTVVVGHDATDPMTQAECSDGACLEASWTKDGAVCIARQRWVGSGMGIERCSDEFLPSDTPGIVCRADPDTAVVFSRSKMYKCGQQSPLACTADAEPVCAP